MISHYLHIPFPEQLADDVWINKWAQLKWLIKKGLISPKNEQEV